jgi:hypothetical protein
MGPINRMKAILIIGAIVIIISISLYFSSYFDGGKAMVIVEPRKHHMLKYVCENFDQNMCKTWDLYIFHGKSHKEHAQQAIASIQGRKVFLIPLDSDNLTAGEYNMLFKQLDFWNQVKAENILVFQTDAVLCPASKYKIKDFMHFDYIGCGSYNGAIGNSKEVWGKPDSKNNSFYGVGGLSFRKNSFQKQCIRAYPNIKPTYPEDVFYSNCVEKSINKPRSATDLANFCTQDDFARNSFGAHKTWYMKEGHAEPFYKFCPAAREIKKE